MSDTYRTRTLAAIQTLVPCQLLMKESYRASNDKFFFVDNMRLLFLLYTSIVLGASSLVEPASPYISILFILNW